MGRRLMRAGRLLSASQHATLLAAFMIGVGCATAPQPDPDSGTLWGYVRLIPKADTGPTGGGYGDRRLAEVRRVDYSHTKYAVVFASARSTRESDPLELSILNRIGGARIEPPYGATPLESGVRIRNDTRDEQIVSAPGVGFLARIAPGESRQIDDLSAGELTVHLLGSRSSKSSMSAQIWVTTGAIAEVDSSGRYVLRHLEPGPHQIRAWHPRLPPSAVLDVELFRGLTLRADFEIGVDAAELPSGEEP